MRRSLFRRFLPTCITVGAVGVLIGGIATAAAVTAVNAGRVPTWLVPATSLVASGFVAMTLGAALLRLLRSTDDRIETIEASVRRLAAGELDLPVATTGSPELLELAQELDRLAAGLRSRRAVTEDQRRQIDGVLSSMIEGVIVLDGDQRIDSMNQAAGSLLQVAPSQAAGRTLLEYVRNAQLHDVALLAAETSRPVERTITVYRERPIHLQVHATPLYIESPDRPPGSLLVMSDVSRIRQLETMRKDFVANVSHELRTPITAIKGFVETLLDEPAGNPGQAERFMRIILNQADRLHLIIEDLLSLSRLEQADEPITTTRFTVGHLLDSALEICGHRATERGITIRPHVDSAASARGNVSLLEQVLVNLLDNAVKYSPPDIVVDVFMRVEADTLTIVVGDHGPGIREQDLPRIFERFYRTDRARSRELGGTGLGLAIVKHIAQAHGGEVTVESRLGEGSRFAVFIPQAPEREPTSEAR